MDLVELHYFPKLNKFDDVISQHSSSFQKTKQMFITKISIIGLKLTNLCLKSSPKTLEIKTTKGDILPSRNNHVSLQTNQPPKQK